ncbi:MAG: RsiV family protein [Candidatus Pacebacteria bacterium]|nr:RsiV family protein [Candidatus Paceibacterota bacterium]
MRKRNESNKGLFFILFIFFIMIIFCFYNQKWFGFGTSEKEPITEKKEVEAPILKNYEIKTEKIIEKSNGAEISVEYPSFSNNDIVNDDIKLLINAKIKDFKDSLDIGSDIDNADQFLNISYDSNRYVKNIFSIKFNIIYGGGIHPIEDIDCKTYDLDSSKEIKLSNIFKQDSDYLNKISGLAYNELIKNTDADVAWVKEGTLPKSENFSKFILKNESIIFYFPAGSVASNASGTKEVEIPLSSLKMFLNNLE